MKLKNNIEEVDVIILVPGIEFNLNFLYCWTNTINYLNENNYKYKFAISHSPLLPHVRNLLVGNSPDNLNERNSNIPFMGKLKYKKVVFIDSDMCWTVSDFEKLIKTDKDVLTGIYMESNLQNISISIAENQDGLILMNAEELDNYIEDFEVLNCGMGFMSCSYGVLEKIGYPWFVTLIPNGTDENNNVYNITGEDIFFCKRITDEGYKIFADPFLRVGHIKPRIFYI